MRSVEGAEDTIIQRRSLVILERLKYTAVRYFVKTPSLGMPFEKAPTIDDVMVENTPKSRLLAWVFFHLRYCSVHFL